MTPSKPTGRTAPRAFRIRGTLGTRERIVCAAIVVAIGLSVLAVVARITPPTRALPPGPDFRMWDTQTMKSIRVSDFRGKVVLLDFMATWCRACRESMPDLLTINRTYGGDAFVLLSVTTDVLDNVAKMEAFRKEFSANWTFAVPVDAARIAEDYGVTGYPTYVLLDREGRIAYRAIGPVPLETLESSIDASLGP